MIFEDNVKRSDCPVSKDSDEWTVTEEISLIAVHGMGMGYAQVNGLFVAEPRKRNEPVSPSNPLEPVWTNSFEAHRWQELVELGNLFYTTVVINLGYNQDLKDYNGAYAPFGSRFEVYTTYRVVSHKEMVVLFSEKNNSRVPGFAPAFALPADKRIAESIKTFSISSAVYLSKDVLEPFMYINVQKSGGLYNG